VIVAIDGPAGSGKSTTARRVAEDLGYYHLDSGLMYRAVALPLLWSGKPASAVKLQDFADLTATYEGGMLRLRLAGEDIQPLLRDPEVASMASRVAMLGPVRHALLGMQRSLGERYGAAPGLVAEGRDMGTVVFPEAAVKIFMTASLAVRAQRRHQEFLESGKQANLEVITASIAQRDRQDRERTLSPLRRASDAISLNTDHYSIDAQVAFVVDHVRNQERV